MSISKMITSILLVSLLAFNCSSEEEPVPQVDSVNTRIVIQDTFMDQDFVVYANWTIGFMQAYSRRTQDGTLLDFELISGKFPIIMKDNEGNEWNAFGVATSGPRAGEPLKIMNSMMGYWFSFAAMFPEVTLYGEEDRERISSGSTNPDWLVNPVFFGALKDGIPALNSPGFSLFRSIAKDDTYINNNELVIVYFDGESVKIYPHKVLDWHEIVNDESRGDKIVVSYCPLTGTASIWNRSIENATYTFGVSGLLHNSNLIHFDRETDSNWSQMKQLAVNGDQISKVPEIIPYFEMTWEAAQKLSGELYILSDNTGTGRNYDDYPYGDYRDSERINFPVNVTDNRVSPKERVLGILINDSVKVYRFGDFD